MSRVFLVGAGCGADAIGARGLSLLRRCDCVIYDDLLDESLLGECPPDCEKIFAGKRSGAHSAEQAEINRILVSCAKRHRLVVRLKGGDPYVFGRGGEEALALREAGIPFAVVSASTSAIAAPAAAGIPVTHRGISRSFHVYTGHTRDGEMPDYALIARTEGTHVFLMARSRCGEICRGLIEGGMSEDMPCALVSEAGMPGQRAVRGTLRTLPDLIADLPAPAVFVVGKTAGMDVRSDLPLAGVTVAVAGTGEYVGKVCALLREEGALARPLGVAEVRALAFDSFFERMMQFSVLAFTSSNGVRVFFARAKEKRIDHRAFARFRFAVVGNGTAETLAEYGFYADIVPRVHTAAGLAERLRGTQSVAVLRAEGGNPVLGEIGEEFLLYRLYYDDEKLRRCVYEAERADILAFSSAQTVRGLLPLLSMDRRPPIVCIGEETAKAVRAFGYTPAVAKDASAESLVKEIVSCRD